jgi:hypothetical protein
MVAAVDITTNEKYATFNPNRTTLISQTTKTKMRLLHHRKAQE